MIKRKVSDYKTPPWSGGTTTELFIYPPTANFKERNFEFRLSTATIEVDESVFTPLNGLDRTFLLLEGNITLSHEGHHSISLNPMHQDRFKGDWTTRSTGKGKPLNLMTQGCTGKIQVYQEDVKIQTESKYFLVYCHKGNAGVNQQDLAQGELLFCDNQSEVNLFVDGIAIVIEIS
jgi:environmental stress-induced protein Ves